MKDRKQCQICREEMSRKGGGGYYLLCIHKPVALQVFLSTYSNTSNYTEQRQNPTDKMGLRNQALHVMLANPHLSPLELVDMPTEKQDGLLVDHPIIRYRVTATNYEEGNDIESIYKMATTLADVYARDQSVAHYLVMVVDGRGSQKPAVREIRNKYQPPPHIEFCRRYSDNIDLLTLKMLQQRNIFKGVYIVNGRKWTPAPPSSESNGKLPVFHFECDDEDWAITTNRPLDGVHIMAHDEEEVALETGPLASLGDACKNCVSTEADTLMVELANSLTGDTMLHTCDSDMVAILTGSGREDLMLRMSNKSYNIDRPMHNSTFGDMLRSTGPDHKTLDFSTSDLRMQELYDVEIRDKKLWGSMKQYHDDWETILTRNLKLEDEKPEGLRLVATHLYKGGIRASVYGEFLLRVSQLPESHQDEVASTLLGTARKSKFNGRVVFKETFDLIACQGERESPDSETKSVTTGAKRPRDEDGNPIVTKHPDSIRQQTFSNMRKLTNMYRDNKVPRYSHGRYLRMTQMSHLFHMRIKPEIFKEQDTRHRLLTSMILFGTDYTFNFQGLGKLVPRLG